VQLACLDESENKTHFTLSAIVLTGAGAKQLGEDLDALIDRLNACGLPGDAELHGHELFHGKGLWHCVPLRLRVNTYAAATEAIERAGAKLFLRCIDKAGQAARYTTPYPAHETALQYLLEDLNDYARSYGEQVLVLADEVHAESRHRTNFRCFKAQGTPGYRSSKLDAILDTLYFGPSDHSRLLQAADLATFMYLRRKTVTETDPRATRANESIWAPLGRITVKDLTSFGPRVV
jgi:hypothetical protein